MKDRTRKILYVSIAVVLTAFAVIRYAVELLTSRPVSDIASFRLNYVVSLPFLLLSIIICAGANCFTTPAEYAVGLGFGTSIDWKKRWSNQIEIQAFGLTNDRNFTSGPVNSIIQLRVPICRRQDG